MSDFYSDEADMDEARRQAERHNEELRERSPERRQKDEEYAKKCFNEAVKRSQDYRQKKHDPLVDLEPLGNLLKFLALLTCFGLSLWLFITVAKWFWQHPLW